MTDFCYGGPMLDQVLDHAELMDRMMERVGVDQVAVARLDQGMAFYEARTRCLSCPHEAACRGWLANAEVPAAAPEFCANAEFFSSDLTGEDRH
jgi:hypothetical protein